MRRAASYNSLAFWADDDVFNSTIDFDANLVPAQDVTVDAVVTSFYFNSIAFVMLMVIYECLRHLLPHVYSSRKRLNVFVRPNSNLHFRTRKVHTHEPSEQIVNISVPVAGSSSSASDAENPNGTTEDHRQIRFSQSHTSTSEIDNLSTTSPLPPLAELLFRSSRAEEELPDNEPLDWIQPVFGVPWTLIRKKAGLDGYFYLRYIRMCVRITAVSSFWFFLLLVPVYVTGSHHAMGWYHLSMANIPANTWRMWMPVLFCYLFSFFVIFVMKQEYRHFLELRQDFLARGSAHVLPQNRYSLMVENIPYELRSDKALYDYFDKLFPGKVHSANVVLRVAELEETSHKCMRTCRRLEKSIAYLHSTGMRPSHRCGQGRMAIMGLDLEPVDVRPSWCCGPLPEPVMINVDSREELIHSADNKPPKGTLVDSISYYTMELAEYSRKLAQCQKEVSEMARSGGRDKGVTGWFDRVIADAESLVDQVMEDSLLENSLVAPSDSYRAASAEYAEHMTSKYGSIGPLSDKNSRLLEADALADDPATTKTKKAEVQFGRRTFTSIARKWAGRLGLDFAVAALKLANKQLDIAVESVMGSTMSSTGFVTFLSLAATTSAASAPLTVKAGALKCSVAPEPREINWQNVNISRETSTRREHVVNIVLFLGVILWSFPLAAIQAFAKAEYLAQLPGMEWILTFHGGQLTNFVNGYLPVLALLGLILVLPVIFEQIAVRYECRKTFSDVQSSMLSRYFYYQLANVYVSVTAGSIYKSLTDILDHPSNILSLLGESLPSMVGYFVALLLTKIMAGLPMIFLRFGALSRMLLLRLLARSEKKVTQRELDWVYRLENVQYGWEFPSKLFVVVIVFTYAIICPIILPVGMMYFIGSLIVYKKQILYVYSPLYESGGALYPNAVQKTLFGLVCSQLTLLGYTITRGCYYEPVALLPLPIITIWVTEYFYENFAAPSTRLSLERARHYDRSFVVQESHGNLEAFFDRSKDRSELNLEDRRRAFDKNAYRQPVLTEIAALPWMYRRGIDDDETVKVRDQLRRIHCASMDFSHEFSSRLHDVLEEPRLHELS